MTSRWAKARVAVGILLAAGASVATSNTEYRSKGTAQATLPKRTFPGVTSGNVRVFFDQRATENGGLTVSIRAIVACAPGATLPATVQIGKTSVVGDLCLGVDALERPVVTTRSCLAGEPFCTIDFAYSITVTVAHPTSDCEIVASAVVSSDDEDLLGSVSVTLP